MEIGAIGGAAGAGGVRPLRPSTENVGSGDAPGFGEMLQNGIRAVGEQEQTADQTAQRFAVGDPGVQIQDVTVAAAEASLSVQLMVAVRDRAVEAYQQIINLQV